MGKYNNDALNELCSKFNLLEYVEENYEVKKISKKYFIHCPLHVDHTPSLCINENENTFHCFSCGTHGSPIDWFRRVEKLSFNDAIIKLQKLTGSEIENLKICESLALYKKIKRTKEKRIVSEFQHSKIDYLFYDKYSKEFPEEWVQEGISTEVLKAYDIRIDNDANRIVYPIFDNCGNLIGCKGRTRFKNYKELDIPKYMNYYKIGRGDFFVGLKENKESILSNGFVIIFEGIKSGLKYTTYTGKTNWISAETSVLNEYQVRILISLGIKDIIIAFDKDVDFDKIVECTNILKRFANVYVVKDNNELLGEKDSPIDKGIDVFNTLLLNKIKLE